MAWPPPVLPINRSDALDQQTNHPADHNAVNQAVNDIVARLTATGLVIGAPQTAVIPIGGALTRMTADLVIPSGASRWLVIYTVELSSGAPLHVRLRMYGVVPPGNFDYQVADAPNSSATMAFIAPAGASVSVYGINTGTADANCSVDGSTHSLFAYGLI